MSKLHDIVMGEAQRLCPTRKAKAQELGRAAVAALRAAPDYLGTANDMMLRVAVRRVHEGIWQEDLDRYRRGQGR